MRRLMDQRGAIAITVALLMIPLVGFTALAVDVGALWMDRKELQNGADSAALALAQSCAAGACESDEPAMASVYATGNKRDANVGVTDITHGANSVRVTVSSDRDHWFAPIIGHDASTVVAAATASWGKIGGAKVIPLTVSDCALSMMDTGTSVRLEIKKKGPKKDEDATACPTYTSGPHIIPGGFGWLAVTDAAKCLVNTSLAGGAPSDTGSSGPTGTPSCDAMLTGLVGEEVLLPLYEHASGTGSGGKYTLVAYAHIRVESYCLNKGQGWYDVPAGEKCTASSSGEDGKFIAGQFIARVALDAELGGGSGPGSTTIRLTD